MWEDPHESGDFEPLNPDEFLLLVEEASPFPVEVAYTVSVEVTS